MNATNPVELLSKLSDREREVLKLFCEGLGYKTICKRLHIAKSTYTTHMDHISMKLGLSDLSSARRRVVLIDVYCRALRETEPPQSQTDSDEEPEPILGASEAVETGSRTLSPESEKSEAMAKGVKTMASDRKGKRRSASRRSPWALVVVIALVAVLAVALGYGMRGCLQLEGVTAKPSRASFTDNFDEGPSAEWEPVQGTWRMVDGTYGKDEGEWGYTMTGNPRWHNYAVEADVSVRCIAAYPIAILLRSESPYEGMRFEFDCCHFAWVVWHEGNSKTIASYGGGLPYICGTTWKTSRLRLEVKDTTYTAYINGKPLGSVQDDTFSRGRVGLGSQYTSEVVRFDNFAVGSVD